MAGRPGLFLSTGHRRRRRGRGGRLGRLRSGEGAAAARAFSRGPGLCFRGALRPRRAQGARPHLYGPGEEDARVRRQLLHVEVHGAPHGRPRPARAPPGSPRPAAASPHRAHLLPVLWPLPRPPSSAAAASVELARARREGRRPRRRSRRGAGRGGAERARLEAARGCPLRPPPGRPLSLPRPVAPAHLCLFPLSIGVLLACWALWLPISLPLLTWIFLRRPSPPP